MKKGKLQSFLIYSVKGTAGERSERHKSAGEALNMLTKQTQSHSYDEMDTPFLSLGRKISILMSGVKVISKCGGLLVLG